MIINKVFTIANPENTAPATKYGGNIVVCHPGITEVAKSKDTMVCTESTNGVAKPAKTKETSSNRCQSLARPVHPKLNKPYIFFWKGNTALSRIIAKSGNKPVHQNTKETERYVEIANTSQSNGELKFTHNDPNWFGIGNTQYANHGRPIWIIGKRPACTTEKIVIASAERLMAILHFCLNNNRTAEIKVPA